MAGEFGDAIGGGHDRRFGIEDCTDPVGGHRRPRDHASKHEGGHHHRHQDLHQIGQEGDEGADLHGAVVDPDAAEPQHRHARDVEHQHHRREDRRHPPADASATSVRSSLARPNRAGLDLLPDERPHHPDAAGLFAQHPVDGVDPALHEAEPRHHPADDEADDGDQDRDGGRHQPGQADVLAQRHDHPADHHDRGR